MAIDYKLIASRHSVRAFTKEPIPEEKADALRAFINDLNAQSRLNMQLVTNDDDIRIKSLALFGMHKNVRNYICLVGDMAEKTEEQLGYYGEMIVLRAQEMGLNTCWLGLTYHKNRAKCVIKDNQKLYAIISIGYGKTQGTSHKIKTCEQICSDFHQMPDWFQRGVEWALLAPTAMNQQKFHFNLLADGRVKASSDKGPYTRMDMGIAKYHFELGASDHKIVWADE